MRLYLAVAVMMLAFVAYTEAQQEEEQTMEQRFAEFGEKVAEVSKNLAEKAKATVQGIHESPFAVETRNWFQEQFDKLQQKLAINQ